MASLQSQLENFLESFRKQAPKDIQELVDGATADLAASGITDRSVAKGAAAPGFSLANQVGEKKSLADYLSSGPVVLTFYRGGWCPYCNLELAALQASLADITSAGAQLVAVTPEMPEKSLTTQQKHAIKFDILSDEGNKVASKYGLEFTLPESLRPIYAQFGIDIPAHNGDDSFNLPIPATFVIDSNGIVRYRFVDADYTKRAEPAEVVRVVRALETEAKLTA